ncbi:MAG: tetratricopeptide repeat protein [Rhodospirillales bacterium]
MMSRTVLARLFLLLALVSAWGTAGAADGQGGDLPKDFDLFGPTVPSGPDDGGKGGGNDFPIDPIISLPADAPASSDDPALAAFKAGVESFDDRQYVDAFDHWQPLARQGHAASRHNLGVLYELGLGVRADPMVAADWYAKAAEENEQPEAMTNLGLLYARGFGVQRDDARAAHWFLRAAERGHVQGQYNLAICYLTGRGLRRDDGQGARWMRSAALGGLRPAQYNLAGLLLTGRGLAANATEAADWFAAAAQKGDVFAHYNLGLLAYKGQGIAQDFQQAQYHLDIAARAGVAPAQNLIGVMYAKGEGVKRDPETALTWLLIAADMGDAQAVRNAERLSARLDAVTLDRAERRAKRFEPVDTAQSWHGLDAEKNTGGPSGPSGQGGQGDFKAKQGAPKEGS